MAAALGVGENSSLKTEGLIWELSVRDATVGSFQQCI